MPLWIGIDVAKDTLAVPRPLDQLLSFPNTAQGHQRLCDHLAGQSVGNALLEATGGYERAVMTALATAGIPVTRINPRRARAFATALGTTAKTDPLDAALLLARMAWLNWCKRPRRFPIPCVSNCACWSSAASNWSSNVTTSAVACIRRPWPWCAHA
ncbi:IS110 family transposase [Xanthomonas translucens]|uniref:IS110 family transposase n=1 Tax=Xanthomonas campestris pv. translucens TaxID=343 RepID=UPI0019D6CC8D|nr:transposase [Xanthomonas translucens]